MKSITVDGTPEECYRAWRDMEGYPRFLSFVEAVRPHREDRFHWVVREGAGDPIEWDVDLVEDRPGEALVWRSIPGSDVEMVGGVWFERSTGGRGTVVRLGLDYAPRTGALKAFVAGLVEKVQLKKELHRFKQWFETGEVATTEGQPSGREGDDA
ncbi:MAG TPA: SRPBCC family protein [Candidatus Polarisedimenticolia bacterium]|nr:SRPBCC family protein [Candidatus Polarisedimenticolia bacterium]